MAHRRTFSDDRVAPRTKAAALDLESHGIDSAAVISSVSEDPIHRLEVLESLVAFVETKGQQSDDTNERKAIAVAVRLEVFDVRPAPVLRVLRPLPGRLRVHILVKLADTLEAMGPVQLANTVTPTVTRPAKPTEWAIERASKRLLEYHENRHERPAR